MRTTLASLWLSALAGGVLPAGAADVTYAARIDEQGQVFVDVSNATPSPVRLTTFVLRFFGARDAFLERATSDCEDDCTVAAGATEAFGPFEAPEGWETVQVDEVLYREDAPTEQVPERRTPAPGDSPAPAAPPESRTAASPRAPAPQDRATSPEAALRELYRWLVRGDYARARQQYTASARAGALATLGEAGFETWAQTETKGATVVEVRLLEPFEDSPAGARVEIAYADGSRAQRRVHFRQEDGAWKIALIEGSR